MPCRCAVRPTRLRPQALNDRRGGYGGQRNTPIQEQAQFNLKTRSQFLALYMAAVAVQLAQLHPDFMPMLRLQLWNRCPYLIPAVPSRPLVHGGRLLHGLGTD